MKQLDIADTEEGWEAGVEKRCKRGGMCRFQVCNVAQGVICCAACPYRRTCKSRCEKVRA